MSTATDRLTRLRRDLARAQRASEKAMNARANLPPGTSRARVTTANARWMAAAEHRDRIAALVEAAQPCPTCSGAEHGDCEDGVCLCAHCRTDSLED